MGAGMFIGLVLGLVVIVVLLRCRGTRSRAPYVGGDDESSADPSTAAAGLATIFTNGILFVAQFTTEVVDDESSADPSTAAAGLATIFTNGILFVAQFTTEVVGTRR